MAIPDFRTREATLRTEQPVVADRLTWMTVHGALCLALPHPQFTGSSRQCILHLAEQLAQMLVETGCLTADEMAYAHRVEAEESPHSD